jgi:hypothetical protein
MNGLDSIQKPKDISQVDFNDKKAVLQYEKESADYNFAIQRLAQIQTEEAAAKSNLAKTQHDAMMSVINNFKA